MSLHNYLKSNQADLQHENLSYSETFSDSI